MLQNKITYIIQDLLLEHKYVIIPQLGGFVSKYQSAIINNEKESIIPPSQIISFNQNLKNDDGLLTNAYARKEGISVKLAEIDINLFVKDIFLKLDSGRTVVLKKIGKLKFNQQLNIEFKANIVSNFNAHSYGLVDVSCIPLNMNEIVEKKKINVFAKNTLKRVVIIVPILVLGMVLSYYINQGNIFQTSSKITASIVPGIVENNNKSSNLSVADQIDHKVDKKNALAYTEKAEKVESNIEKSEIKVPKTIVEKEISTLNKFQLVAGSFKSKANAKRLSKKIEKLNFQPQIVKNGSQYRVIASTYSNKEAAKKVRTTLKNKKIKTWINTLK